MKKLNLKSVTQYVEEHIGEFHQRRLDKVNGIELNEILEAKNPYLFKAKNVNSAPAIVEGILSAYLSSSEEGIFGNWLERLAIFVNDSVYSGRKAGIDGIDLDFDKDGQRYLVAIKSGPKWSNGDQLKKLIDQFNTAKKRLQTSGAKINIVCVNGCCYGKSNEKSEYKKTGGYYKICGQRFWELISDDSNLYIDLIEPLGKNARENNDKFKLAYDKLSNRITAEFLEEFCFKDGSIDWEKLVRLNSGPREKKKKKPK